MKKLAYLGVDYHVKTVTITVYLNDEGFYETVRFNNSDKTIAKYLKKWCCQLFCVNFFISHFSEKGQSSSYFSYRV